MYQRDAPPLLLSPCSPALMGLCLPSIKARVAAASEPAYSKSPTAVTVLPHMEQGFGWIFLVLSVTFTFSFCTSVAGNGQPPASAEGVGRGKERSVCSVQMAQQLWQHIMGTGDKNRSGEVGEWCLRPSAEMLQGIHQRFTQGSPVFPSLARNCSNPKPSNQRKQQPH